MLGTLSVRENLQFSANLRLPAHLTQQQRRERVDRVIEELGLQACANTKVYMLVYDINIDGPGLGLVRN